MTKVKRKSGLSSMLGERVKVRNVNGDTIVDNRPKRKVGKLTENQAIAQEKFQEATKYANRQILKASAKELYTSGITTKKSTAYMVALTDYLTPPKVQSIEAPRYRGAIGDKILVKAKDDFMVTSVEVQILDQSGVIIEEGEAGPDAEEIVEWTYTTTVANPTVPGTTIRATAYDRPRNKGVMELVL